jgi:hypothetical protein
VRTQKENGQARGAHVLESAERWTNEHEENTSERGVLTNWRAQIDGPVKTRKGRERARGTHVLESAERRTSEDTGRKRAIEGHSRPGEHRATDG